MAKRMTMCGKQFLETVSKEYRGDVVVAQQFVWERCLVANSFVNLNLINTVSGRWRLRIS